MDLSWAISPNSSAKAIAILPCAGDFAASGYWRSTNPLQNSAQPNKHCKVAFIKHVFPRFFNPVCGSGPFEGCFCEGRRGRAGNGAFVVAASTTEGSVSFFFGRPTARMNWLSRIIASSSSWVLALLGVHACWGNQTGRDASAAAGKCGHDGVYPLLVCGQPDVLLARVLTTGRCNALAPLSQRFAFESRRESSLVQRRRLDRHLS